MVQLVAQLCYKWFKVWSLSVNRACQYHSPATTLDNASLASQGLHGLTTLRGNSMSDRIKRLEVAIQSLEAKGKPCKSLESQLKQLIRDQQRQQDRQYKQQTAVAI